MSSLLDRVMEHEGFREKPYQCSEGVWTFGHGLTYITPEESRAIVAARLHKIRDNLMVKHPWLNQRDPELLDVLCEMAFQLGWGGLHKFKKMWGALKDGNYQRASSEMLDSQWRQQTPGRAEELAGIIKRLSTY